MLIYTCNSGLTMKRTEMDKRKIGVALRCLYRGMCNFSVLFGVHNTLPETSERLSHVLAKDWLKLGQDFKVVLKKIDKEIDNETR